MSDTMAGMDTKVVDRPEAHRYEIIVDGAPAGFAAYRRDGRVVSFTHTEIRPQFEGQGLGSTLARGVLEASRERGDAVLPYCPFIQGYLQRHATYVDLVPDDQRQRFGLPDLTTHGDG